MTLSSLWSAKCSGLSEGERLYRVRFGQIAAYVYTEDGDCYMPINIFVIALLKNMNLVCPVIAAFAEISTSFNTKLTAHSYALYCRDHTTLQSGAWLTADLFLTARDSVQDRIAGLD